MAWFRVAVMLGRLSLGSLAQVLNQLLLVVEWWRPAPIPPALADPPRHDRTRERDEADDGQEQDDRCEDGLASRSPESADHETSHVMQPGVDGLRTKGPRLCPAPPPLPGASRPDNVALP